MRLTRLWMKTAILACGLGVFTSCSIEDNPAEEPIQVPAFLTMLKSLDWGTDTTYVYGHKVPDVDAVCSSLGYARLMRALGYNCEAKLASAINRETAYIAGVFGFALPELKSTVVPQTRLILTDHSDFVQCVDGAKDAKILQMIDHHVEGSILDSSIPYVRREIIGAACTIVYEMYKELGVGIDDETARILLAGIVSDTRNLSKPATCAVDSVAWEALTAQLAISPDSMAVISAHMKEADNNIDGMTDKDIFMSDYKGYEYNGYLFGMGSLDCVAEEMDDFIDRLLAVMPSLTAENGLDMLFAKIDNKVLDSDTGDYKNAGTYFIYYGNGAQAVAETLFGSSLREGVTYSKEKQGRKQIVPLIQELLAK